MRSRNLNKEHGHWGNIGRIQDWQSIKNLMQSRNGNEWTLLCGNCRRVSWASSASKIHLHSGLCLEPLWGNLQRSPRPLATGGEGAPFPRPRIHFLLSAFGLEFLSFGPQECPLQYKFLAMCTSRLAQETCRSDVLFAQVFL